MNKFQAQYAVAKARYETALKIEEEECKKIEHLMDEDEDLYVEKAKEIGRRLNRTQLYTELRQAEDEMIAWANDKVSKNKHYSAKHQAAMKEVMENIWRLKVRRQMVDLAFRLA